MTEFVSEIKTIPYAPESVYGMLSDLSNLERIRSHIPADKVSDVACDRDSCTFTVAPVGKQTLCIVEREENKTVKLTGDNSPIEFFLWVQLKEADAGTTHMKMTVRAELNPFIKPMVERPLREGIEKLATIVAALPYGNS